MKEFKEKIKKKIMIWNFMRYKKQSIVALFSVSLTVSMIPLFFVTINPQDNDNTLDNEESRFYYNLIKQVYSLTDLELQLLEENKFIVLNRMGTEDIIDAYKFYWDNDLPIIITTDTILQTWHLIFDVILTKIEEEILYPLLCEITEEISKNALVEFNNGIIQKKTLIYFLVASKFINSSLNINLSMEIENATGIIYQAITEEISIYEAISRFDTDLTRRFIDDFTQYKPRGHYVESEILKNYFHLFKWFSRIPFFFDNHPGEIYLQQSPSEMIKSAIEITWLLKSSDIEFLEKEVSCLEVWDIFRSFIDILVGKSESITIHNIDDICIELIGDFWNPGNVNNSIISLMQEAILNDTSIPKPEIPFMIDAIVPGPSPKNFVFFGERFTLDSYAFQHLVYPYVDGRFLPTSLDFAATCLESQRAEELLESEFAKYPGLLNATQNLQEEIRNIPEDEKQTVQWRWIESLEQISGKVPECNETVVLPEFMNRSEWLDEKLTTIMGSYAQLRHDTILYAKQSITYIECSTPTGFVEPYPEFYKSIGELSEHFKSSLSPLETLGYDFSTYEYSCLLALDLFTSANQMLMDISIKELKGIPLSDEEKEFIMEIYVEGHTCGTVLYGWLPRLLIQLDYAYSVPRMSPNSRVSLVADIHTDTNTQSVLHLATGLLEPLIAFVPGWDGQEIPMVGPVFSFYEFNLSNYYRLNDYEWRGIMGLWLEGNERENHDFDLFPRGFWAQNYMISTDMTMSRIFWDNQTFYPPEWF